MLIRATIVLLVVLNLGVAAWWLWRPDPVPAVVEHAPGVPRLVLLEEVAAASPPAQAPVQRPAPMATEPGTEPGSEPAGTEPPPEAGPPASPVEAGALAGAARCEGSGEGAADGWRVYLPPSPDLATAEALARRIAAAGFSDYLVLRDGPHANGIALGMFSTEAGAQRRSEDLRAEGFPARGARIAASTPA